MAVFVILLTLVLSLT